MNTRNRKNRRGLTLVELIVTIAIFLIVSSIIGVFIYQGLVYYGHELSSNSSDAGLRNGMDKIITDMRKTTSDNISVGSNTLTVNGKAYKQSGSNLLYNGSTMLKNIKTFTVSLTNNLIDISIETTAGDKIATSYSLK